MAHPLHSSFASDDGELIFGSAMKLTGIASKRVALAHLHAAARALLNKHASLRRAANADDAGEVDVSGVDISRLCTVHNISNNENVESTWQSLFRALLAHGVRDGAAGCASPAKPPPLPLFRLALLQHTRPPVAASGGDARAARRRDGHAPPPPPGASAATVPRFNTYIYVVYSAQIGDAGSSYSLLRDMFVAISLAMRGEKSVLSPVILPSSDLKPYHLAAKNAIESCSKDAISGVFSPLRVRRAATTLRAELPKRRVEFLSANEANDGGKDIASENINSELKPLSITTVWSDKITTPYHWGRVLRSCNEQKISPNAYLLALNAFVTAARSLYVMHGREREFKAYTFDAHVPVRVSATSGGGSGSKSATESQFVFNATAVSRISQAIRLNTKFWDIAKAFNDRLTRIKADFALVQADTAALAHAFGTEDAWQGISVGSVVQDLLVSHLGKFPFRELNARIMHVPPEGRDWVPPKPTKAGLSSSGRGKGGKKKSGGGGKTSDSKRGSNHELLNVGIASEQTSERRSSRKKSKGAESGGYHGGNEELSIESFYFAQCGFSRFTFAAGSIVGMEIDGRLSWSLAYCPRLCSRAQAQRAVNCWQALVLQAGEWPKSHCFDDFIESTEDALLYPGLNEEQLGAFTLSAAGNGDGDGGDDGDEAYTKFVQSLKSGKGRGASTSELPKVANKSAKKAKKNSRKKTK